MHVTHYEENITFINMRSFTAVSLCSHPFIYFPVRPYFAELCNNSGDKSSDANCSYCHPNPAMHAVQKNALGPLPLPMAGVAH